MIDWNPAYVVALLCALLAATPFLSSLTPRQREKALDRYARKVNLALTSEVRPRVVRRIAAQERSTMAGGILGALVGLIVGLAMPHGEATLLGDSGTILAVGVGLAVGMTFAGVAAAVVATLRPTAGRRIARPAAPELDDYVPPMERWFALLSMGCAGLALAGGIIALATETLQSRELTAGGLLGSGGAVLGYLAMAAYLLGRVLARRVLNSGQPAGSEQELAWDDAMRASTLRGLTHLPTVLAVASVFLTFITVGDLTLRQPMVLNLLGGVALLGFTAVSGVLVALDAGSRPGQHYWRRLWQAAQPSGAR